jgi:hypothetical protein
MGAKRALNKLDVTFAKYQGDCMHATGSSKLIWSPHVLYVHKQDEDALASTITT